MKATSVTRAPKSKLTAEPLGQPVTRSPSRPRHLTAASSSGEIVELPAVTYTAAELAQSKPPVRHQQSMVQQAETAPATTQRNMVQKAEMATSLPASTQSGDAYNLTKPKRGVTFGDIMNFGGTAPELTNSRLAMLGFVAATAAEISSGESIMRQLVEEPTLVNVTFVAIIAASLAPALQGKEAEAYGPFTPQAEIINGRAAMIGFAALLATEIATGSSALDVFSRGMPII